MVSLDDVQWADEASLDSLIFLSAELSRASVLVAATARGALPPGIRGLGKGPRSARSSASASISSRAPIGRCRAVRRGGHGIRSRRPRSSSGWPCTKCGGNPLFLQETCPPGHGPRGARRRSLASHRRHHRAGRGAGRPARGSPSPACRRRRGEALEGRVRARPQEFDLPVLGRAPSASRVQEDVLAQLDEADVRAVLHRAWRRSARGPYGFTHDTIREAIYERARRQRGRSSSTRRVARAFEQRVGRATLRLNDLAYHTTAVRLPARGSPAVVERYATDGGRGRDARLRRRGRAAQFFGWALDAQRFRGETRRTRGATRVSFSSFARRRPLGSPAAVRDAAEVRSMCARSTIATDRNRLRRHAFQRGAHAPAVLRHRALSRIPICPRGPRGCVEAPEGGPALPPDPGARPAGQHSAIFPHHREESGAERTSRRVGPRGYGRGGLDRVAQGPPSRALRSGSHRPASSR